MNIIDTHLLDIMLKGKQSSPFEDETTQRFLISNVIIKEVLGAQWWNKHCGDGNFNIESANASGEYKFQISSEDFAEALYIASSCEGFREWVHRRLRGEDLYSAYCELEAAKDLLEYGYDLSFTVPSGREREGYDFRINADGKLICAETASKKMATALSVETIAESLTRAKGTLPHDHESFILLYIPQKWTEESRCAEIVDKAIADFFTRPGKVSYIFVKWDKYTQYPDGVLKVAQTRIYNKDGLDEGADTTPVKTIPRFWFDLLRYEDKTIKAN